VANSSDHLMRNVSEVYIEISDYRFCYLGKSGHSLRHCWDLFKNSLDFFIFLWVQAGDFSKLRPI